LEHHALSQEFSAFAEALESRLATRSASGPVERKRIEHEGRFALLQGMLADVLAVALANCASSFSEPPQCTVHTMHGSNDRTTC
jgi:hypothetical protein